MKTMIYICVNLHRQLVKIVNGQNVLKTYTSL